MTTLQDILDATAEESKARQNKYTLDFLKRKVEKMGHTRGFHRALSSREFSVIAEIKRKSPSMGTINSQAIDAALEAYENHELVSAISVLTQNSHFGGSPDDLEDVRKRTQRSGKPLLRKDFINSEYEVYYSRWIGADAILLMASVVTDRAHFKHLHDIARKLGMDVLCEVHDAAEIAVLPDTVRIAGINSRKFKGVQIRKKNAWWRDIFGIATHDTQTDLAAFSIFNELPAGAIRVAESGVSPGNLESVLVDAPFNAALVGTSLLKSAKHEMKLHLDQMQAAARAAGVRRRKSAANAEAVYAAS